MAILFSFTLGIFISTMKIGSNGNTMKFQPLENRDRNAMKFNTCSFHDAFINFFLLICVKYVFSNFNSEILVIPCDDLSSNFSK